MTVLTDARAAITGTRVDLREVGLREVLQSHDSVLETAEKVEIFNRLRSAGCSEMNVVAFVNPNKMPQMADTEEFLRSLGENRQGATLSGLVPNERGLNRALTMHSEGLLDTGLLVFSESAATLSANGMDANHDTLLNKIEGWAGIAADEGLKISVFVSASYGCSIEGPIDPARVVRHAAQLRSMRGVNEVIISDSTGQADPLQVLNLLTMLAGELPVDQRIGLHFHDTRGSGLANLFAALLSPFQYVVVDTAFGGWGGDWPFVPDAFGNVATEDVVEMMMGVGIDLGIDVGAIMDISADYALRSGRPISAKLTDARPIAWKRDANRIAAVRR